MALDAVGEICLISVGVHPWHLKRILVAWTPAEEINAEVKFL